MTGAPAGRAGMIVRAARAADVPALRELVHAAFVGYVDRIGEEPMPMRVDYAATAARCWVAEEDGRITAMAQIAIAADHLEVETIAVHPARHGHGVGTRLLALAEARARALGLPEVRLCTNEAMTENLAYYARRGFREVGRGTEEGFRRVFFVKPVRPDAPAATPRSRPPR